MENFDGADHVFSRRVNKKKKTKKGRELEDSIVNMLQSGLDRILDH